MASQPPPPSRTASVGPPSAGGMNAPQAGTPGAPNPNSQQNLNQIVSELSSCSVPHVKAQSHKDGESTASKAAREPAPRTKRKHRIEPAQYAPTIHVQFDKRGTAQHHQRHLRKSWRERTFASRALLRRGPLDHLFPAQSGGALLAFAKDASISGAFAVRPEPPTA